MFDGRDMEPGNAEFEPGLNPKPGSSPETAVPVSEVNAAVRHVIEQSFAPLWIRGEVANWKPHRTGHRWFSLRDDSAQIQAVMWRSDAARLPTAASTSSWCAGLKRRGRGCGASLSSG